ncbi:MAG: T9SS type A sorting domain-containing protein [Ignavibacteria bacterium]|nr:T9SS type A sorting domain-containing protein [Ignavibacteria bacterium]
MNIVRSLILLGSTASVLLSGCATHDSTDAPSAQGRREFELLKYRDPATGTFPDDIRARELLFARTQPGSLSRKDNGETVQDLGEWRHRGPWNIGGRTRAVAFDAGDEQTILVGAVSGGMWMSTDDGSTWTLTTKPDQLHSVTTIAQDTRPSSRNVWYYGTGEIYGNSSQISGNGIWKSTDHGASWFVLPSTTSASTPASHQFAYTWRIVTHPLRDSNELYVATARSGIQRSTNGGTTWTGAAGSNALFSDVTITPNGTLYAAFSAYTGQTGSVASRWGVYRSTDGITWVNITPKEINNQTRRIVVAPVPQNPDQIFVLAETPGVGAQGSTTYRGELQYEWHSLLKYTYVSGDGAGAGGQWDVRSANIPLTDAKRGDFYSQGGYDLLLRVSPFDSNLVVIGGTNLYCSTDGFTSTANNRWIGGYDKDDPFWDKYSLYPNHHPDQHDVVFHPTKPNVMLSVNDGGIQRTDSIRASRVSWTDLNRGYLTTQFYTIDQEPYAESTKLIGGMQDNATWATDNSSGTSFWRRLGGGDGAYCYFTDSGRTEYYSSQQGRMFRIRRDAAGNEVDRSRIDPSGGKDYLFINPYVLHPTDQHIMYLAGGSVLWRNNNLRDIPAGANDSTSVNWDSLPTTNVAPNVISSVCATSTSDDAHHVVYFGTDNGKVYRIENAEVGVPTPVDITSAAMPRGAYVNSISVDPLKKDHLVLCFSNYGVVSIWETHDAGATWSAISGNLEELPNGSGSGPAVNWVGIAPYDKWTTVLIAATSTGPYVAYTTFGMSTVWTQTASDEIGNVPCDMAVGRASDGQFAIATHGRGVYTGKITSKPSQPEKPTPLSPDYRSHGIYPDTVLTWSQASLASSYAVQLWETATPKNTRTYAGIRETKLSIADLVQGPVVYSWNVEAFGAGGSSTPSETWTFTTAVRPPLLLSPAPGATGILQAVLTWERVPQAYSYGIEVSPNAAFNPVVSKTDGHADTSILVRGLESNKRYFWRVRSANTDTIGLFSNRQSFVTGLLSSINETETSATSLRIEPNPAASTVRVCVPSNVALNTVLEVVNSEGRLVLTSSISDCTQLDVSSLANGTYTVTAKYGTSNVSSSLVIKR